MARRKAVNTDGVTDSQPTQASLEAKIELLQRALLERAAEAEALRTVARSGGNEQVTLMNTGLATVVIPDAYGPDKDLVLNVGGARKSGTIPYDVYVRIERDTDFFQRGLLRRVGDDAPNPNVIPDPTAWVASLKDKEITKAVSSVTSEGTLHMLWNYLIKVEDPSGKELLLRKAITNRTKDLFDYDLVEDEFGE